MGYAYYFPWGEVHRYYRIEGNLVQFVASRNGVYSLTWQAVLSRDHDATRFRDNDTLARYLARLGYTGILAGLAPLVASAPQKLRDLCLQQLLGQLAGAQAQVLDLRTLPGLLGQLPGQLRQLLAG